MAMDQIHIILAYYFFKSMRYSGNCNGVLPSDVGHIKMGYANVI